MTTNTIDYSIENMSNLNGKAVISLSRKGLMPMPLDIEVTMNDGSTKMYYIPLEEMRGEKNITRNITKLADWAWAYPTYELALDGVNFNNVKSVTIDPKEMMADVNKDNNTFPIEE